MQLRNKKINIKFWTATSRFSKINLSWKILVLTTLEVGLVLRLIYSTNITCNSYLKSKIQIPVKFSKGDLHLSANVRLQSEDQA